MLWHAKVIRTDAKGKTRTFNIRVDRPQSNFSDYIARLPIMNGAVKIEWVPTEVDDSKPRNKRTAWDKAAGVVRTLVVEDGEVKSKTPDDDDLHHGGHDESPEAVAERKDPLAAFRQRPAASPARSRQGQGQSPPTGSSAPSAPATPAGK